MTLRPLREGDEAEYVRVATVSEEAWRPWIAARAPSVTEEQRFAVELRRGAEGLQAGSHVRLWGFLPEGTLVGMFALNEIVRGAFQSAHAGWQVSVDRQGRGFGTEGVHALVGYGLASGTGGLGLHRVQANIMPSNEASLRIAEKVGFRREGLAERYLRIAGRWEDHVMLAITREEWAAGA